ncbi:hypothetical protein ACFWP7_33485 [Streptomyces sp. NPDC058470]|uniref:hypothetical protein n=1 Tax=Streptomyces sp. NPDC058470 TaxID=3346515 RepID=UPI003667A8B8
MASGPGHITWPPPELAVPPVQLPPTAPVTGADDVRRYDGLSYATNSGYRARLLDLFVPPAAEPAAVVVWIHGGAWMEGDRRHPPPTVSADLLFGSLPRAGPAVATIDGRKPDDTGLEGAEVIPEGDTTVAPVVDSYGITDAGALLPADPVMTGFRLE